MAYQVMARRYRPNTFDEVVGQVHVTETLKKAMQLDRLAHAFLFAGPRGVGKTSMARILSAALNCLKSGKKADPCGTCESCTGISAGHGVDVVEIDGASHTGVDNIRDLRERVGYAPSLGKFKIYIIDEVHMLSTGAFNALLKTLEEPPAHVRFIFATTELHKVPDTIVSRCQLYNFKRIPAEVLTEALTAILKKEKIKVDAKILQSVALRARGGMRDALMMLDQALAAGGGKITPESFGDLMGQHVEEGLFELMVTTAQGNLKEVFGKLFELWESGMPELEMIDRAQSILRDALALSVGAPLAILPERQQGVEQLASHWGPDQMLYAQRILETVSREAGVAPDPRIPLEMGFIKMAKAKDLLSLPDVLAALEGMGAVGQAPVSAVAPKAPATVKMPAAGKKNSGNKGPWAQVMAGLAQQGRKRIEAMLKESKVEFLEKEKKLMIRVLGAFHQDQLSGPEASRVLEEHVAKVYGKGVAIHVVAPEDSSAQVAPKTEAKEEKDYSRHPLVNKAKEIFDGRIIN